MTELSSSGMFLAQKSFKLKKKKSKRKKKKRSRNRSKMMRMLNKSSTFRGLELRRPKRRRSKRMEMLMTLSYRKTRVTSLWRSSLGWVP